MKRTILSLSLVLFSLSSAFAGTTQDRLPKQKNSVIRVQQQSTGFFATAEEEVLLLVNQERESQGLVPLQLDTSLQRAARVHSKDMGDLQFFSHQSPVAGRESFVDRIAEQGLKDFGSAAENIAAGPFSPEDAAAGFMELWMNSSGHRRNILNPDLRFLGVGIYKAEDGMVYATQNFSAKGKAANRPPQVVAPSKPEPAPPVVAPVPPKNKPSSVDEQMALIYEMLEAQGVSAEDASFTIVVVPSNGKKYEVYQSNKKPSRRRCH
jgi:uncharacterized protein YkwD